VATSSGSWIFSVGECRQGRASTLGTWQKAPGRLSTSNIFLVIYANVCSVSLKAADQVLCGIIFRYFSELFSLLVFQRTEFYTLTRVQTCFGNLLAALFEIAKLTVSNGELD